MKIYIKLSPAICSSAIQFSIFLAGLEKLLACSRLPTHHECLQEKVQANFEIPLISKIREIYYAELFYYCFNETPFAVICSFVERQVCVFTFLLCSFLNDVLNWID